MSRIPEPAQARKVRATVAIPASVVSDTPHLREKTGKIGSICRAISIYRIDELLIYPDISWEVQDRDVRLISTIASYLETPQYLRKQIYRRIPELAYAGILSPLRIPSHPLSASDGKLKAGEIREGLVINSSENCSEVYVGVPRTVRVKGRLPLQSRVAVRVLSEGPDVIGEPVDRREIRIYWGYRVTETKSPIGEALKRGSYDLKIATSRFGSPISQKADAIAREWKKAKQAVVTFGSPTKGLREILAQEGLDLEQVFDFVVNMIPNQGTETVRTEEAVHATLAVLNLIEEE